MTRQWSEQTKRWVVTAMAVLALLALLVVGHVLPPFVLAAVLAYILSPLVGAIQRGLRLPRTLAAALVYLALMVLIVLFPAITAPRLIQQVSDFNLDVQSFTDALHRLATESRVIVLFGMEVDLSPVYEQVLSSIGNATDVTSEQAIQDLLRSLPTFFGFTSRFASGFASTLFQLVLTLVISFYLVRDVTGIGRYIDGLVPPDYRDEINQVRYEISAVWNGFFRGQLILSLVVGIATGTALWLVGVRSAFALGVLAGILEIIPNIGPIVAAVPAVVIAFLQGSTHLTISNFWFAVLVIGLYVIIQEVENHYLVPRIIGRSVNLHPVVVLFGVLAGASIAGILGIFLAAPVLATIRVIVQYAHRKMLEVPMLPVPAAPATQAPRPTSARARAAGPESIHTVEPAQQPVTGAEVDSISG
jgi:predicted PurR-regulated permease PerM